MTSSPPGPQPRPGRTLDAAERDALRRIERTVERDDPGFAALLRAPAIPEPGPPAGTGGGAPVPAGTAEPKASAAVRAWLWILCTVAAVLLGLVGIVVVERTLGGAGLAAGGAILLLVLVGLVVGERLRGL